MPSRTFRIILFIILFVGFWFFSTLYIGRSDDNGAAWWSMMGMMGFPLILTLFILTDLRVINYGWVRRHAILYLFLSNIVGIALYYPVGLLLIMLVVAVHA